MNLLINNKYTWFFGHRDKASMFSLLGSLTKVGASNQLHMNILYLGLVEGLT